MSSRRPFPPRTRIDPETLRELGAALPPEDRDEMAIPSYLHKNPLLRWMAWRRVEVVARWLAELCPARGTVLDFGCGTGVLFEDALRTADRVIGVDLVLGAATAWVARRGLDRVTLLTPDQADTAVADGSVDVVLAAESLEHVDPLGPTLALFRRVLRPTGRLLVTLPTENRAYRLGRRLAGFDGHFHHHDAAAIERDILAGGFALERGGWIPAPGPFAIYRVAAYRRVA